MFDELWEFAKANTKILAQEKSEMEHVFNLIKGSESYLEIGTSEGNSLYIFGHALKDGGHITYVDRNEKHTMNWREPKVKILKDKGYLINAIHGDCHDIEIIQRAQYRKYDCVFIDAGHKYSDVVQDIAAYAHLATKYLFFHDVMMQEVMKAFREWVGEREWYIYANSNNYGYGIVKL